MGKVSRWCRLVFILRCSGGVELTMVMISLDLIYLSYLCQYLLGVGDGGLACGCSVMKMSISIYWCTRLRVSSSRLHFMHV